jgi:3-methyladenine DNA glycosylase AlkD
MDTWSCPVKKEHGHVCKICGRCRANEKFSGKGHAQHVCKDCAKEQRTPARAKRKASVAGLSLPAAEMLQAFKERQNPPQAAHLARFFKTCPGQYGEGDRFLGLKVPITRELIKPYGGKLSLIDYAALLRSEWHEVRLGTLLLMCDHAKRLAKAADTGRMKTLMVVYDQNLERANNWDLVDLSVRDMVESYWKTMKSSNEEIRGILLSWADSGSLWRERSAMVATYARQRMGSLDETFWLAERFINHPHDLMHKASGWMLREAGKRDVEALRVFLSKFHRQLPRTALRYAIERLDADERARWMGKN